MAIKLTPDNAPFPISMAWILATWPDEQHRDGAKAESIATRLCELSGWDNFIALDKLSAAYAESGRFAEAVKWQTKAVELAPVSGKAELQSRLRLYEASNPFRQRAL